MKLEPGPGGVLGEIRYSILTPQEFEKMYGREIKLLAYQVRDL